MKNVIKQEGSLNPLDDYLQKVLSLSGAEVTGHRIFEASGAEYGESHTVWSAAITRLLENRGIRLYSHQSLGADHLMAGRSIVAATPTASGKSLIYNLPVLENFLRDPDSRALYLFPLKALAQDQTRAFNALCSDWPVESRPSIAMYDGDTDASERKRIRLTPPTALVTTPEMLHLGILPFHENWAAFLANLAFVVVDEAHTYRGVFGSHMAQVFRRLNRLCGRYGATPVYAFCTATLGNPGELAAKLLGTGEKPVLIDRSGAPGGKKHFLFVNPAQSSATCAIDLLRKALENNLRTIVYCRSRRMAELISVWAAGDTPWKNRISSYRAGYTPEERREIERKMADGVLMAVVSTSALELGIDVGGLDVCILAGYPGTVMQTLQRGGRVGRKGQDSAVLIIADEDALDQYFVRNPDDFYNRPAERAIINPENNAILACHLECAAAEVPLHPAEAWLANPAAQKMVARLEEEGILAASSGGQWRAVNASPQRGIDLRGSGQAYLIEDEAGHVIGSMDGIRAWKEGHPGAIYLHRGQSYLIEKLDSGKMTITARPCVTDWFTRTRGHKSTDILEEYERRSFGGGAIFHGRLRVSEFITGYEKRAQAGQRLLTVQPLAAPPHIFETEGIWVVVPEETRKKMEEKFIHFMGSIHAFEHAAIGMMPLQVMADRNDFGGISIPMHPQLGHAAVFIYDSIPGGAGLASSVFENPEDLLQTTLKRIEDCGCEDGCPSCIHSPKCGAGNRPLSKSGAIFLLRELLASGEAGKKICEKLVITPAPDRLASAPVERKKIRAAKKRNSPELKPSPGAEAWFGRLETGSGFSEETGNIRNFLVFDVETRKSAAEVGGWRNAAAMGVSVACVYEGSTGNFFEFRQEELPLLFEKMRRAELVIGFNSIRFDYEVLRPFAEIEASGRGGPLNLRKLPTLDLFQKVAERTGTKISLDNLAMTTLGVPKSANGMLALKWWREGQIEKIGQYCRKDVELTRDLYLYALEHKCLYYLNKAKVKVKVEVELGKV